MEPYAIILHMKWYIHTDVFDFLFKYCVVYSICMFGFSEYHLQLLQISETLNIDVTNNIIHCYSLLCQYYSLI